jgi:HEAT repeat protein
MNAVAVLSARRGRPPAPLVQALVLALASADWGDRERAASALGRLGEKGDLVALAKAAGDPSGFVREAVAYALANDAPALDVLLTLSRDEIWQVRAAAARSLGTLKDDRAHKRRGELVADPEPHVRAAAGGN